MSEAKIPVKLGREPIADVTFELRFQGAPGAAGVLPGLLFGKLASVERIESLPASQVPEQFRAIDPNFRYVGLHRLHWGRFVVVIGQNTIALGCKLPYPGWADFKAAIFEVLQHLPSTPFVVTVERCSLKYINLFEAQHSISAGVQQFAIDLTVGGITVADQNTQLRVELREGGFLHAVTMATNANLTVDGVVTPKTGAILDVDTLAMDLSLPIARFMADAPALLEELHRSNHQIFFKCLKPAALEKLEPKYE